MNKNKNWFNKIYINHLNININNHTSFKNSLPKFDELLRFLRTTFIPNHFSLLNHSLIGPSNQTASYIVLDPPSSRYSIFLSLL